MNDQSTSTKQNLSNGPADMPDRGGSSPDLQSTSERVSLGRTPVPVAAFGARPSMGEVQCNSEKVDLSRSSDGPYAGKGMSETTPETPFSGSKRGRR